MRIKSIELRDFKRFTHLIVDEIPKTAKMIILVGPNGSGKTSFFEGMNHYYKWFGYANQGNREYLKKEKQCKHESEERSSDLHDLVNIYFHDIEFSKDIAQDDVKGCFYFRSAYRNEPSFQITSIEKKEDPTKRIRLSTLSENDQTVSDNYQRLVVDTVSEIFNEKNNEKTVQALRDELFGKIRDAMNRIFEDLEFSSLGEPLKSGNFYFTKGISKNFVYSNLSAGEKAAFDLILDLVIHSRYYPDAVYCIDEPEAHLHTILQGRVLHELYALVPGESQLWISTHSIGMLQAAEELEKINPGTVIFLDFGEKDFDVKQAIYPSKKEKAVMDKFYELVFGDFAKLILPKTIVICEGDSNGNGRRDFDKSVYTKIFEQNYPGTVFISGGSCKDIENIGTKQGGFLTTLLGGVHVIKIIDRDDRTESEIRELNQKGIKVLKRRNLEAYLLDDTLIKKLCEREGKEEEYEQCIQLKRDALQKSVDRGNPNDDYKHALGDIYTGLKKKLSLTKCGSNADIFVRDVMVPLITSDMEVYKQLESEIFDGSSQE